MAPDRIATRFVFLQAFAFIPATRNKNMEGIFGISNRSVPDQAVEQIDRLNGN
jgi:hypothetical protein